MSYLWITRFPPYPPLKGGAFDYSRDLVESLARTSDVLGLAYAAPEGPDASCSAVAWTTLPMHAPPRVASLLSALPNVASRNVDRAFLAKAIEMASGVDAVFVDFIAMAWLVEPLKRSFRNRPDRPRVIMINHNHEHAVRAQMARGTQSLPMRAALTFDAFKAGQLERQANRAADGLTAITTSDRDAFATECATPSITLPPAYSGPILAARRIDAATPATMAIVGNRNAHHKMMVLERTLAAFAELGLDRDQRVEIAGEGEFGPLAARYPRFAFAGYVPDLASYLAGIRLGLLSDDIGGGFKIRAMSYAMLRVPMLALREAMLGMEFEDGVHFVGVDTMEEMVDAARALIGDFDRLNALQEAAFAFARERFDPAEPGRRMERFVGEIGRERATARIEVVAAC